VIGPADAMALVELLDALAPAARYQLLARYCHTCGEIVDDGKHDCQYPYIPIKE